MTSLDREAEKLYQKKLKKEKTEKPKAKHFSLKDKK